MSVKVRSRLFYRQQGKKNLRQATLTAWYRVNPQTDSGTVQPSAAKAMEGILRTLRFTPLIFASKKNLRQATLTACHP